MNRITNQQVQDALGTKVAETISSYDSTSLTAVTGMTHHDDTNYGTGNTTRGNRTSTTDALANTTTFTYDVMNRLTAITQPGGATNMFAYDTRGRRTSVTDANAKTTAYGYDDADRLLSVTDAAGNLTIYGYDTENHLASISDALGRVTSFDYDALGRVTGVTFPSTFTESYTYDAVGNLTSKTDRKGQTINYSYDNLDRLTAKSYPDSTSVSYTYDGDSRLTQASDPTGTYSFGYDHEDRLSVTTTDYAFLTGRTLTTSYRYDPASNRTSITDPEGGATNYTYDSLNRVTGLTDFNGGAFGFSYDALGRRTNLTRPNGVSTAYTYDNLSRLLQALHKKGNKLVESAGYTYDAAGNRTSRTETTPGQGAKTVQAVSNYSYDAIYELTQAVLNATTTETYSYDGVGNRLSSLGVSPYSYNSSNELTSKPGVTFAYDNNGNTTGKTDATGTTSYAWDFENRLTSVTLPGTGGTVSFKYDPFGRRVQKVSSASTTVFAYDGDNLIEELSSTGTAVARYTQGLGIDEPLAMSRSGVASYYHADGLGSIQALTNSLGTVVASYVYDSFGNLTASTGTITNPFRYTAREFDSETGLYYYRARYYDPTIGRFVSEDPITVAKRDVGELNPYPYTSNNPLNELDPNGMGIVDCAKALAELARAEQMLAQRIVENACGRPELRKGHDKAIEQLRNRVQELRQKVQKHCTDKTTIRELTIIGTALAIILAPATNGGSLVFAF